MAKSVHNQKKRVTHIGKLTNDNAKSDDGMLMSECIDYVHNIMQEMDSSIKSVGCDKSDQICQEIKYVNVQKNNEARVPNTTSSNDLQNLKASNLKKYSLPRKYPLMEKSQKILKQIKHNRSIPKQRAHLASFQDSLLNKDKEYETAAISVKKQKNSSKVKEKVLIKKNLVNKIYNQNSFVEHNHSKYISKTAKASSICPPPSEQSLSQRITENSNSYLSDSATDGEYERFIQKNKIAVHKKAVKNQSKSKKILRANKNISMKKLSGLEKNNKCMHSDPDFSDYSSSDSDDNNIQKRKISHSLMETRSSTVKKKQCKRNVIPEYDEFKTCKKKTVRSRKVSKEKSKIVEENIDTGSSLQSWPEQCDSNFHDDSTDSDNENTHKRRKVSFVSMEMGTKDEGDACIDSEVSGAKKISGFNVETASGLLCEMECESFSPEHSSLTEEENLVLPTSSEIVADNVSDVSFPSNLVFCLKSNELNSKYPSAEAAATVNDTSYNLSQNQVQTSECCLGISELSSLSNKFSTNFQENSVVITLSSESDTEAETVSVSGKNNSCEIVIRTQNTPLCKSDEESDLEIIEVISSKKNVPSYGNVINDSENLTVEDSSSLYTQDKSSHSESHLIEKITKCSVTTDEANFSSQLFADNIFENTVSKEEIKKIVDVFNIAQVKKEKISNDAYSATYITNICREFNETEIVPKINELLRDPASDGTSHIESENYKSIDCVSSIIKDVASSTNTCSVKLEKVDNDIVIIDSEESSTGTFHNAVKEETCDDDIIIIDSFTKSKSKDIFKIKSSYDSVQTKNICSSVKAEKLDNALQNHAIHCADINKLASSDNSTPLLKSHIKSECHANADNLQVASMQEKGAMMKKESQVNSSDRKGQVENAMHFIEMFKKEFNTYQEILRTEKNVQAGLKFVEAHQAQKLTCLRSKIQALLKDESDNLVNSNCVIIKEQHDNLMQDCVILNNPEIQTLKELQHSFGSCSEMFSKNDCSTVQDSHDPQNVSQSSTPVYDSPVIKKESDNKSVTCLEEQITMQVQNPHSSFKSENSFIEESSDIGGNILKSSLSLKSEEKTLDLLDKKCSVCGKDAVAACQRCAKAFFCSHKCGKKFWIDGHEKICGQ